MPRSPRAWTAACLITVLAGCAPAGDRSASEPSLPGGTHSAGPSDDTYRMVIAPIFQSRCSGCHGASVQKSGLSLLTPDSIALGSSAGPVIVPGNSAESELVRRLKLPLDDEGHMPPKSKPQPSPAQIKAIEQWIAAGAVFSPAGPAKPPVSTGPTPPVRVEPPPASPAAVEAISSRLIHIEPIAKGSTLLLIDFAAVAPRMTEEEAIRLLTPVREQVGDLSLARMPVGDATMKLVASMPNLHRLNVAGTRLTDAGVALLAAHRALTDLILSQTAITDAAAPTLIGLPALERLYVWKTSLTSAGLEQLRTARFKLDTGDALAAEPLERETEVKLTTDPAPAAAVSLKPVNTVCPVSGKPVDPEYAIVYKGRVIGFCCKLCAAQFWDDPAKFAGKIP